jgi:hypothetical protein
MPASVTIRGSATGLLATFGIPTVITFLSLDQVDEGLDPEFMAKFQDQTGITIGVAYGPTMPTANFQGTLLGTVPVAGQVFSFNSLNYIIEKVGRVQKNQDFIKASFAATAYPGIPNP